MSDGLLSGIISQAPSSAAELFQPVTGLGDSLLGAYTNISQTRAANATSMQNWWTSNKYNSPSAQMARLREAGLNPNLVYGHGSVANTSSGAPTAQKAGPIESTRIASGNPLNANIIAQNKLLEAQAKSANMDVALKGMEAAVQSKFYAKFPWLKWNESGLGGYLQRLFSGLDVDVATGDSGDPGAGNPDNVSTEELFKRDLEAKMERDRKRAEEYRKRTNTHGGAGGSW